MNLLSSTPNEIKKAFKNGEITVTVFGMGKMGLPLAAVFADKGAKVIGVDIDEKRVNEINSGTNPIKEEPGLDELVKRNVEQNRLRATADGVKASKEADIMIILVPTIIDEHGIVNLEPVKDVAEKIAKGLERGNIVITEATMPPGTTESLVPTLEKSGLKLGEFGLAHCPERTMTGTAIRDITGQYPKIVGANDSRTLEAVSAIYEIINLKGVIKMSSIKAAEAVKVFEGVYRDVNIGLANELALFCEEQGLDALEVFNAANTQPYCHIHRPGAGVGGHCFAKDEFIFLENDGIEPVTVEELFDVIEGDVEEAQGVLIKRPKKEYRILSFDPSSGKTTVEKITLATKRKLNSNEKVLEIKTRTGRRVKLTENHLVWVYENDKFIEKPAKMLTSGDYMAIVTQLPQKEIPKLIDVLSTLSNDPTGYKVKFAELTKETISPIRAQLGSNAHDYMRYNYVPLEKYNNIKNALPEPIAITRGRGSGYSEFPPEIKIDNDFATLLGYYISEGCITKDKSLRIRFSFNVKEKEYIREVETILKKMGIRYSEYVQNNVLHIKVSSKAFGEILKFLGTGVNSYDAKVPNFMLYSKALQQAVLRGIINGDGSVLIEEGSALTRKNNKVYEINRITANVLVGTASDKLAQQLFLIFQNIGIVPSYKKNGNVHILRIFGFENLKKLKNILGGEKANKLNYYLEHIRKREKNASFRRMNNFALLEIREIKPVKYDDYVYSFEVENTNTIVTTSGLVVHNCIPVYPWFVMNLSQRETRIIRAARVLNDEMPNHIVELTLKALNQAGLAAKNSNILVLGLTFRGDVYEFRKSPSIPYIKKMKEWTKNIYAYDPVCTERDAERYGAKWFQGYENMDAVIIINDAKEFKNLNLEELAQKMRNKIIVDGRGLVDKEKAKKLGFIYLGVGRV